MGTHLIIRCPMSTCGENSVTPKKRASLWLARESKPRQWRRLAFEPLEARRMLATITVNTLVDENNGIGVGGVSLREAVAVAAANDTVNFSVAGTIHLTSAGTGHINVNKSLTIQGPGANVLTIRAFDPDASGNNDSDGHRVFFVSGSGTLNVAISGLTLTNGDPEVSDENKGGGAIFNEENLTVANCVLAGNFAPNGGAIYSPAGTLNVNDCTITDNDAGDGGGLLVDGGTATITRTTISNNTVTNSGGGILGRGRPLTIVDSTISGNSADERGGGLYTYQGSLTITNSTISGNTADANSDQFGSGGGIYNLGGGLAVTNSTISGNTSGEDGGGIFSDTAQTITIRHSTVVGNSISSQSGNAGGGIRSIDTATLDHTIVAGNLRGTIRDDVSGVFDALFSLIGDRRSTTVSNLGGSLIGTSTAPIDPVLGPLTDNGGPTLTHALLTNSPARDAGNAAAMAGAGGIPQFDQRGTPFSRVFDIDGVGGARIDIGALEMTPPAPALPGDYNVNHVVDAADFVLWRKTQGTSVLQYSGADGNGNGIVDVADHTVWRSHFSETLPLGSGSRVATATALESQVTDVESSSPIAGKRGWASHRGAAARRLPMIVRSRPTPAPTNAAVDLLFAINSMSRLHDREVRHPHRLDVGCEPVTTEGIDGALEVFGTAIIGGGGNRSPT